MTAFEYLELAHNGWATAMATVSLAIAVLSGYVVIAYMVGRKLSFTQVAVLNIGHIGWSCFLVSTAYNLVSAAHTNANIGHAMLSNMGQPATNEYAAEIVVIIGVYLILASLWFMWSVRHPNENHS